MLKKYILWCSGYIKIKVKGSATERFLNLCKHKEIPVWDITPKDDSYEMFIPLKHYKDIKTIRRKTRIKISILKKCGLPFFIYKFQERKCFFFGILFSFLFIIFMSRHIWEIEFSGNQYLTEDVLVDYLKTQNVYVSSKKNQIPFDSIVSALRKEYDEIVWASVSLNGTILHIEVKEKSDVSSEDVQTNSAINIYASKSGVIAEMITRKGVPLVKAGDEIEVGDCLVSGTIDVQNDAGEVIGEKYVEADADIWIEYDVSYYEEINNHYVSKEYVDEYPAICISILNQMMRFSFEKEKETTEYHKNYSNYGPLTVVQEKNKIYEYVDAYYTSEEKERHLEDKFLKYCSDLEKRNCKIVEKYYSVSHDKDHSYSKAILTVRENVGVTRKRIDLSGKDMIK